MPTNEERREVAENLRIMTAYGCRYAEQFYELLQETVMDVDDFHDFGDVANRLADLIEPEPERACIMEDTTHPLNDDVWTSFKCSECHEDITISREQLKYCPCCGAKVVE